ncbi:MAG TPA: phosphoglycerate mutase family protein [Candidatus Dormibacteraeota bacterium]
MPGSDSTSFLVRHAKAGSRERWTSPDRERPLTDAGRQQATALIDLIGSGVRSVRSSPYLRCLETVDPLAKALGLLVEEESRLAEGSGPEWAMGELAASAGSVLCTHGDVMAELVNILSEQRLPMKGGLQWAKAGTWAFEISSGRIVAGRYLPPPV